MYYGLFRGFQIFKQVCENHARWKAVVYESAANRLNLIIVSHVIRSRQVSQSIGGLIESVCRKEGLRSRLRD